MSSHDPEEPLSPGEAEEPSAPRVAFTMDEFESFVEAQRQRRRERYRNEIQNPLYQERLVAAAQSYTRKEEFATGTLVTWKQNLKSMEFPEYGAPAVFMRYLTESDPLPEEPRIDQDCLIGWLDEDLDLIVQRANSHRFTAW